MSESETAPATFAASAAGSGGLLAVSAPRNSATSPTLAFACGAAREDQAHGLEGDMVGVGDGDTVGDTVPVMLNEACTLSELVTPRLGRAGAAALGVGDGDGEAVGVIVGLAVALGVGGAASAAGAVDDEADRDTLAEPVSEALADMVGLAAADLDSRVDGEASLLAEIDAQTVADRVWGERDPDAVVDAESVALAEAELHALTLPLRVAPLLALALGVAVSALDMRGDADGEADAESPRVPASDFDASLDTDGSIVTAGEPVVDGVTDAAATPDGGAVALSVASENVALALVDWKPVRAELAVAEGVVCALDDCEALAHAVLDVNDVPVARPLAVVQADMAAEVLILVDAVAAAVKGALDVAEALAETDIVAAAKRVGPPDMVIGAEAAAVLLASELVEPNAVASDVAVVSAVADAVLVTRLAVGCELDVAAADSLALALLRSVA